MAVSMAAWPAACQDQAVRKAGRVASGYAVPAARAVRELALNETDHAPGGVSLPGLSAEFVFRGGGDARWLRLRAAACYSPR